MALVSNSGRCTRAARDGEDGAGQQLGLGVRVARDGEDGTGQVRVLGDTRNDGKRLCDGDADRDGDGRLTNSEQRG